MVVILVGIGRPPHGVLGVGVHDDVLIFGGATGVDAGHDVHGAQLGDLALFIAGQLGLGFLLEQLFIGRIVNDFGRSGNAILSQIEFRHNNATSLHTVDISPKAGRAPESAQLTWLPYVNVLMIRRIGLKINGVCEKLP